MSRQSKPKIIAFLIMLIAIILGFFIFSGATNQKTSIDNLNNCDLNVDQNKSAILKSSKNYKCITLEKAITPQEQEKGLSGRASMADTQGMLFEYDKEGNYCYWMKDMQFSIDMIWVNREKKVVTIRDNVSPNTYPNGFCPTEPAQYVIELNAGVAKKANISKNTQLKF